MFLASNYQHRGKLPGLFGGEKLSGGNHKGVGKTGMSLRLMWRADGAMEAYAYAPIKKSDPIDKLSDCHVNPKYGTSLMRGKTNLIRGQKNAITLMAKMNDPGQANGVVTLTVNGQESSMDIVTLRTSGDLKFSGIFFSTFFGGGDKSWATPKEQELLFSDFTIQY
jgi:hypothetical protein